MEFEFDPTLLDPNETLLISLMKPELHWSKDICDYVSSINGLKFSISGSHIERRSGGGIMGAITGVENKVIEDYWTYRLRMASKPGEYVGSGIEIKTGDFNGTIDDLLHDLYWFADTQFLKNGVANILNHIGGRNV